MKQKETKMEREGEEFFDGDEAFCSRSKMKATGQFKGLNFV